MPKASPFTFIKNISESTDKTYFDENYQSYNQFLINRGIAFSMDCLFFAQEINKYQVPDHAHYKYFSNVIPKRRRYIKWAKPEKNEYVPFIQKYFEVSLDHALSYLPLLTEEACENIRRIVSERENIREQV